MKDFGFQVDIATPSGSIYSGYVVQLVVRGTEGDIGVHKGHAPLLTAIQPCMVTLVKKGGEPEYLYVEGGMMEIQPRGVNILADTAARGDEIDLQHALAARQHAQQMLENCSSDEFLKFELELVQALAQLRVAKHSRKGRR